VYGAKKFEEWVKQSASDVVEERCAKARALQNDRIEKARADGDAKLHARLDSLAEHVAAARIDITEVRAVLKSAGVMNGGFEHLKHMVEEIHERQCK